MVLSPRSIHLFKLSLIVIIIFIAAFYLFSDRDYHHAYRVAVSGKKAAFVEKAVDVEIDGPFDNSSMVDMCAGKHWRPGLIFHCQPPRGGIANIRNIILNCVRYAIEAGATSIIVPEIKLRLPPEKPTTSGPTAPAKSQIIVPFSEFFDLDWFKESLAGSCPQITVIGHKNDLYDLPTTQKAYYLNPEALDMTFQEAPFETLITDPSLFAPNFTQWLNETTPNKFSASAPLLVDFATALLQWPLVYDSPDFVATFGRIIRPRKDLRELASTILFSLSQTHSLPVSPSYAGIQRGKFYGAHLRTSDDAKKAGWTPYHTQATNYLQAAKHNKLSVIYLVCGSELDIEKFTSQAANYSASFPIAIATALSLLSPPSFSSSFALYTALSSPQKSLIDSLVLLKSSIFGGTLESSFSWNIALRRHVVWGNGTWVPQLTDFDFDRGNARGDKQKGMTEGPVGGYGGGGFQSFRDGAGGRGWGGDRELGMSPGEYGFSVVFGSSREGQEFEKGLWP